jgi:orotate phosphoribosyltransferase-like protein
MRAYDYVDYFKIKSLYYEVHPEVLRQTMRKTLDGRGILPKDLAEILNISNNTVTSYLHRTSGKKLDLFQYMMFAAYLDIDVRNLFKG